MAGSHREWGNLMTEVTLSVKHQVGDLTDFENGDPVFDSYTEALQHAVNKSDDEPETPLGVWELDSGELVAIVHEGRVFTE